MNNPLDDFLISYWDSESLLDLDSLFSINYPYSPNMLGSLFLSRLTSTNNDWKVDSEGLRKFMGIDGSIDLGVLEKTLTQIKVNSFQYLYQAQLESVGYRRFDLTMSDFKQSDRVIAGKPVHYPRKYVAYLNDNFIDDGKRIAFKRSVFFNKEINIFDVANNPELFSKTFMVFIDGKFYDNIQIYCDEDKTYLIITIQDGTHSTGLPEAYFEQLRTQNSKVTVFFIPNCAYGIYKTNINVLNKYKDNLALNRFNIVNNLDSDTKYITFVNNNDLLFGSVITDTSNSQDMLRFENNALNEFTNKLVHLNIFGFRHLLDQIDIGPDLNSVTKELDLSGLGGFSTINSCDVSSNGKYVVIVGTGETKISLFRIDEQEVTKLQDPTIPPDATSLINCKFSPDNTLLVVTSDSPTTPISIYEITQNDVFTKSSDPDTVYAGPRGVTFSPDGLYLVVGYNTSPFLSIYKKIGNTFKKLNDPNSLPTGTVHDVTFSNDGVFLSVAHSGNPQITIYKRVGDTFVKINTPSVTPNARALGCSFSPDNNYLSIVSEAYPFLITYKRNGENFLKISDPDVLPTSTARSVSYSHDGKYVIVVQDNAPSVIIYQKNEDSMIKLNNIESLNLGATDCALFPKNRKILVTYVNGATIYQAREPKFFEIPRQDMPIPVENVMIFRNINGNKYFAHDIYLKLYYPNFYEIIGNENNDSLTIYVFYTDDKMTKGFQKYTDELEVYKKFLNIDAIDYENNQLPSMAKEFIPTPRVYDIKDYQESGYYPNDFFYKLNKFIEWFADDPDLLRQYLKNRMTNADGTGFYIDCSKLDLNSKYRINNHQEAQYESDKETFDGSYYVFVLRNEFFDKEMHYRFFIDGLLYAPKYMCQDDRYQYYYLPVSMVSPNSIIEVEKFVSFEFNKNIKFVDINEKIPITLKNIEGAIASDLFIVKSGTKEYVNKSAYDIEISIYGTTVELPDTSARPLPVNFNLILKDESLLNLDLTVYVKKYFYFERFDIETEEDRMEPFIFQSKSNNDPTYIRAFKNGRFIPLDIIHTQFSNKMDGQNIVFPQIAKQIDDVFVLDYTPYRYTQVYKQETIDEDGFVNLRGKIDKPFDLNWYDVYLNGRKLFARNIDIISPTVIRLKNVLSRKNLLIIQKNRDPEFFHIDQDSKTIIDRLLEEDSRFFDAIKNSQPPIEGVEPDIIHEVVSAVSYELWLFFKNVISVKKFINPDLFQISDLEKEPYPLFFNGGNVAFVNPDFTRATKTETKIRIFPQM